MNEVERANRDILVAIFYEYNIHQNSWKELDDLNRDYNLGIRDILLKSSISPWTGWLHVSQTFDGTSVTIDENYYANVYGVMLSNLGATTIEVRADLLEVWTDAPRPSGFPLPVGWSWKIITPTEQSTGNEASFPLSDIPASNRFVSLQHNQIEEIELPLDNVIKALDANNGLPEDLSFRQRMLGQLRAGLELIRAGEFKVYILQVTLIAALNELVERYRDNVIGNLASTLIAYLLVNGYTS